MSEPVTYKPFDQTEHLNSPPWSGDALERWEAAHGHDVRLKCYPEYGCLVIEKDLERKLDAALAKLDAVRALCGAQGEDSYVMVYALRRALDDGLR